MVRRIRLSNQDAVHVGLHEAIVKVEQVRLIRNGQSQRDGALCGRAAFSRRMDRHGKLDPQREIVPNYDSMDRFLVKVEHS